MTKWLSIAAVVVVVVGALTYYFFNRPVSSLPESISGPAQPAENAGLIINDAVIGAGPEVTDDHPLMLALVYTGSYDDGAVFQNETGLHYLTQQPNAPLGWDKGIIGMKIGGTRIITILPSYAGRTQFADQFPADKTVIYKITLYSITELDFDEPFLAPPGTPQVQPGFQ